MRAFTFLLMLAVAFAAIDAAPQHFKASHLQALVDKGSVKPKDWLSDMIALVSGQDAIHFLNDINNSLTQLEVLVRKAEDQLRAIMDGTTPEVREEIQAVINEALQASIPIIEPILYDLERVLPIISSWRLVTEPGDVGFIIGLILGRSFDEFLEYIGLSYVELENLISLTLERLKQVIGILVPEFAALLRSVMDETLAQAWNLIKPILDVLQQIFPVLSNANSGR